MGCTGPPSSAQGSRGCPGGSWDLSGGATHGQPSLPGKFLVRNQQRGAEAAGSSAEALDSLVRGSRGVSLEGPGSVRARRGLPRAGRSPGPAGRPREVLGGDSLAALMGRFSRWPPPRDLCVALGHTGALCEGARACQYSTSVVSCCPAPEACRTAERAWAKRHSGSSHRLLAVRGNALECCSGMSKLGYDGCGVQAVRGLEVVLTWPRQLRPPLGAG